MDHTTKDTHVELGQKTAFAFASLLLGIASFLHLLGVEKAFLAIAFGVWAVRPPRLRLRMGWARAGIVLGCLMIIALLVVIIAYHGQVAEVLNRI